jgi:ketosteroid isomerase-like protein
VIKWGCAAVDAAEQDGTLERGNDVSSEIVRLSPADAELPEATGESPLPRGGTYEGREAIAGFLRRFVSDGIVGEIEDVLVNGPPWRTRVCAVMTARATAADATVVYDNRAALYAIARWGRIVHQEDFEDTHKSVAFADYLNSVTDIRAS